MCEPLALQQFLAWVVWAWHVALAQPFLERLRQTVHGNSLESIAVIKLQTTVAHSTEAVRLFQYRLEYRRELARRGIDNFQYFGGRGLLLQCFALLGQEPRVLDGDDSLVGKALEEVDLLEGERPHFGAVDKDRPDQRVILDHRDAKGRSRAPESCRNTDHRLHGIICTVAHLLGSHDAIKMAVGRRPEP